MISLDVPTDLNISSVNIFTSSGKLSASYLMKDDKELIIKAPNQTGIYQLVIISNDGKTNTCSLLVK